MCSRAGRGSKRQCLIMFCNNQTNGEAIIYQDALDENTKKINGDSGNKNGGMDDESDHGGGGRRGGSGAAFLPEMSHLL